MPEINNDHMWDLLAPQLKEEGAGDGTRGISRPKGTQQMIADCGNIFVSSPLLRRLSENDGAKDQQASESERTSDQHIGRAEGTASGRKGPRGSVIEKP